MTTINASTEVGESMSSPPRENLYRADFNADLALRESNDSRPTLTGHFARFGEFAEIDSVFEGHFLERMAPGAFSKTIAENRANMKVLFQHGKDVLGQQVLGPIETLREDDQGAYYEVPLYDGVPELIVSGLRGGAYGSSFRFKIMQDEFVKRPARSDHNPKGLPERTIKEAQVKEFGPVTFPAYAGATAGIRSLSDEFLLGQFVDDPDRLLELVEALKERRATENPEPEPPVATTPPAEKPERSVATTPHPVTLYTGQKEQPEWLL